MLINKGVSVYANMSARTVLCIHIPTHTNQIILDNMMIMLETETNTFLSKYHLLLWPSLWLFWKAMNHNLKILAILFCKQIKFKHGYLCFMLDHRKLLQRKVFDKTLFWSHQIMINCWQKKKKKRSFFPHIIPVEINSGEFLIKLLAEYAI